MPGGGRKLKAALCGGAIAALAALALAPGAEAAEVVAASEVKPRLEELTIRTGALAGDTHVRVLLPLEYELRPKRRWPVVYLLHAAMGDHTSWSKALEKLGSATNLPAVVVMPDGGHSGFYTDWFNGGAGGSPAWEAYHVGELLPVIDSRYRTLAERGGRILMGASMGGFGAFSYAARHPDLFGAAISVSGALDTNYPLAQPIVTTGPVLDLEPADSAFGSRASQEIRWRAHNPWDLAANLRGLDLQIRTHSGQPGPGFLGLDGIEYAIHEMSESLHSRLEELAIAHLWRDYGPGGHSFATAAPAITDSLDTLATVTKRIRSLPPVPSSFDHVAADPSFSVWGWNFVADPQRALEFLRVSGAGREGVTLEGSGTERVTTAPLFRRYRAVDVTAGGVTRRVRTTKAGRLRFAVILGAAHPEQQYTPAAAAAGAGSPGYFTASSVAFAPRQRRHHHHHAPPGPP